VAALLALVFKLLTGFGALVAFVIGFLVYNYLGLGGWFLLLLFLGTSTVLGKINSSEKKGEVEKRGWTQVLANGIVGAFSALYYGYSNEIIALVMFGSSVAAATADTWATEAGLLSKIPPVSIYTFKRVEKGQSGGITPLGLFSSLLGSSLIGLFWYATFGFLGGREFLFLASIIALSGFSGSLIDSLLGATIQAHYYDKESNKVFEKEVVEGKKLRLYRGIPFFDNDMVNLTSNICAVIIAVSLSTIVL